MTPALLDSLERRRRFDEVHARLRPVHLAAGVHAELVAPLLANGTTDDVVAVLASITPSDWLGLLERYRGTADLTALFDAGLVVRLEEEARVA